MVISQDPPSIKIRSIDVVLIDMARDQPNRFLPFFTRARIAYPAEVASACIRYLAEYGLDASGQQMLTWLCDSPDYLYLVLHPQAVSLEAAKKVFMLFRQNDPQFFTNLLGLADRRLVLTQDLLLRRALDLLDDLDNSSFFVRWLQRLTHHKDERVRSKAVKWVCSIEPSKDLVQHYLQTEDDRVRANAVEALWGNMTEEVEAIFIKALNDKHHRTVANGIVGLYPINQDLALEMLIEFVNHSSPMFRLAMVWAISKTNVPGSVELLCQLSQDESMLVRTKARTTLANYENGKSALAVSRRKICPLA